MKLVIIIAIAFVLLIPIPVFAQDVYIQIDDLPEWAGYASNVMYLSTEAWKEANEGLEFYIVDSGSDFTVKWVREFGGEYVGYAYGNQFIEVGLGDSNCGNQWNPYSERYISHIMKHEIGHIFGHEHNNNPDSIMYPVALNREYGLVEEEYRLSD
ncbi:MAG: matrixin family metalloprotease, partial [Nitrosopumilus sp.]